MALSLFGNKLSHRCIAIIQFLETLKHVLTFKCKPILLEVNDNILVGLFHEVDLFLNFSRIDIGRLICRC